MAHEERRDILDPDDTWWTIDQAAAHFGMTRAAVERYIRDGLQVQWRWLGGYVKRDEFLAERRRRILRQKATRAKSKTP